MTQHCDAPLTATPLPRCVPFSICSGNQRLHYDGECLYVTPSPQPVADGTYTQVTIQNGCIVAAGQAPVPSYTPSECCDPAHAEPGHPVAPEVMVSPLACNLVQNTPSGLAATLFITSGNGVLATGCGTVDDPLRFSAVDDGDSSIVARSGDETLYVHGDGSFLNPLLIGLNPSGVTPGNYGGLMVNAYGIITGVAAEGGASTVKALVGMDGISAQAVPPGSGIYHVALMGIGGVEGTYALGKFNVTINGKGQVSGVAAAPAVLPAGGSFYTPADPSVAGRKAKRITYNTDGIIVQVEELA
jgi:hypothetical protein